MIGMKLLFKVLVFVFLASCSNHGVESFMSDGTILGPDMRECICCGGYFIEINDSVYNFDSLPPSSGIDLDKAIFPLAVKLDWEYARVCGGIQYISISRIAKD
jgi:hypothetical protein